MAIAFVLMCYSIRPCCSAVVAALSIALQMYIWFLIVFIQVWKILNDIPKLLPTTCTLVCFGHFLV